MYNTTAVTLTVTSAQLLCTTQWDVLIRNPTYGSCYVDITISPRLSLYDIFINCNWVVTRWQ